MEAKWIIALIPLILIQIGLMIYCIMDWLKRTKFKLLNRWVWLIIIILGEILGPILYLTIGRDE